MMSWELSRGKSQESNTHKNVTWKLLGPLPVLPMNRTAESEPRTWGRHGKAAGVMRKQMAYVRLERYCANQKAMPDTARTDRKAGGVSTASALTFRWKHETGPRDTVSCFSREGHVASTLPCVHLLGLEKLPRCCRLATTLTLRRSSANP